MPVRSTEMSIPDKNQHLLLLGYLSESQIISACADGIFEEERKTQYLQTWRWSRTKQVIPGFRPVRSLSANDLPPGTALRERYVDPLNNI